VLFIDLHGGLNSEQKEVFDYIMNSIGTDSGGVFFVYGSGGTRKTYLWKMLIACIRAREQVVLSVASSGIAALLLPGGRNAHSRFVITFDLDKDSCCFIDVGSDLAELINVAQLIIWDEAPLQNMYALTIHSETYVGVTLRPKITMFLAGEGLFLEVTSDEFFRWFRMVHVLKFWTRP
jgi:hypothetical protein